MGNFCVNFDELKIYDKRKMSILFDSDSFESYDSFEEAKEVLIDYWETVKERAISNIEECKNLKGLVEVDENSSW